MPRDLSDPIPTKFSRPELAYLDELARRSGLSRSEIIRRCVWLLKREAEKAGNIHAFLGALGEERLEPILADPAPTALPRISAAMQRALARKRRHGNPSRSSGTPPATAP